MEMLSTIQKNLTSLIRTQKNSLTKEVDQLQLLTQKYESLTSVVSQYQEKLDINAEMLGSLINTQLNKLNQSISSNVNATSQENSNDIIRLIRENSAKYIDILGLIEEHLKQILAKQSTFSTSLDSQSDATLNKIIPNIIEAQPKEKNT